MAENWVEMMIKIIQDSFAVSGVREECGAAAVQDVFVTMRDGILLHTYMVFPEARKKNYPVLLTRTCYPGQDMLYRTYGMEFAKRGYVYIYQYARGREKSEGEWIPNIHERQDGLDTVDWIIQQPWCECLGYWGHSYTSLTGWAMADAVEGKVTSMYLEDYGTDRFCSAYEKGLFRHDVLTSWSMENGPVQTDASYERYIESCKYMPINRVDEALWGCVNPTYREYISSPNEQDEIWQSGWWKQLREIPSKTRIPLYIVSGWYDHHHGSSMKTWERLHDVSKKHSTLKIGAWNHFFQPCIPGREIKNMHPEEMPGVVQWFERTLKRKEIPEKKILLYQIGEDRWMESQDWDKKIPQKMNFQIGKDLKLSGDSPDASKIESDSTFDSDECRDVPCYTYVYDPQNPVMSIGGEVLLKSQDKIGSLEQPAAGYRSDVLSFVSNELENDLVISGKIYAELYVSSDCEDTAFTAKIIEESSDGKSYHVRSSVTTLAQEVEEYVPGEIVKVTLEMWDIAYTIKAGHKLRVDITSSDFPQHSIHCNRKGLWSEQTETKLANQKIYAGEKYPSRVILESRIY